jgi:Tol biopolymer transport system component
MIQRLDGTDARAAAPVIDRATTGRLIFGDWSPDGRQLLFTEIPEPPATAPPRLSMWIIDAETGRTVRHVSCGAECYGVGFGSWSPDGKRIAATVLGREPRSGDPTTFTVVIVDLATGARRTVLEPDDRTELAFPRWSPDGTRLVLQRTRWSGGSTSPAHNLGSSAVVISSNGPKNQTAREVSHRLNAAKPDWGWRNDQIVFTTNDPDYPSSTSDTTALYTVAPDGTRLREVKSFPAPQVALTPSWSPRGPIVFTHCAIMRACYAAQVDADGSNLQTPQRASGSWPRERPASSR